MERYTLDRAWDNWVSARRVLVRNCRWTEKCSDGRAKFFNTLSCLCAFILCSNLLTPAKYAHSMLILINCKKWLSRETQVDSTHRSVHIFQNIFFEPLSSKMFWFRLSCHVYEQCPPEAIGDGIYSWLYLWNCLKPKSIKQNMKNIIRILDLIDSSGLTRLYSTTMFFFRFLFSSLLDGLLS